MTARRNVPPSQNLRKKAFPPKGKVPSTARRMRWSACRRGPRYGSAEWSANHRRSLTAKVRFHLIRRLTPPASPWGEAWGAAERSPFHASGFALILLQRIYSFCIIFKISTNCYPHGFKKALVRHKIKRVLYLPFVSFRKIFRFAIFHFTPERRPLSWKKAVLLPPLPAGCIWAI